MKRSKARPTSASSPSIRKGADVPSGNTEFQFKAGDLNFHSTSYEWLVVAGNKAQFRGAGMINGVEGYTFTARGR